jgi:hypothetical protein
VTDVSYPTATEEAKNKVIFQNPVALVNDLIGVGSPEGATACRVRRLVVCYVVSLL